MSPSPQSSGQSGGANIPGSVGSVSGDIVGGDKVTTYMVRETVPEQPPPEPIYFDIPSLPERYRARETDFPEVRAKLLGDSSAIGITSAGRTVGLKGMGGVGKTVPSSCARK